MARRDYSSGYLDLAYQQRQDYRTKYEPLLLKYRDQVRQRTGRDELFKSRAVADLGVQLRGADVSLEGARNPGMTRGRGSALSRVALGAEAQDDAMYAEDATNVVRQARGQSAMALSGLGSALRSDLAGKAQKSAYKHAIRMSRIGMVQDLLDTAANAVGANKSGGGSWLFAGNQSGSGPDQSAWGLRNWV